MGPRGCPGIPLQRGHLWGLHSTAITHHRGGEKQSSHCALSPALSPDGVCTPAVASPSTPPPMPSRSFRNRCSTCFSPLCHGGNTPPSHQNRAPPSCPRNSHNPGSCFYYHLPAHEQGSGFCMAVEKEPAQTCPALLHTPATKVLEPENPAGAAAANTDFIIQPCPRSRSSSSGSVQPRRTRRNSNFVLALN